MPPPTKLLPTAPDQHFIIKAPGGPFFRLTLDRSALSPHPNARRSVANVPFMLEIHPSWCLAVPFYPGDIHGCLAGAILPHRDTGSATADATLSPER